MKYEEFCVKYTVKLNEQQHRAVSTVDGAVLVLAVPGSGKTTVLVYRLGYMLCGCNINPGNVLVMTYTLAATADMKNRFVKLFGADKAENLEFRTINSVAAKIIKYFETQTGRKAFPLIGDAKDQAVIISESYNSLSEDRATESTIRELALAISYIKNMMLTAEEIRSTAFRCDHVPEVYEKYLSALIARSVMDYDDQIVYAVKILKSYPEILTKFRRTYKYICVDEAQDTSKIQHELIRLLAFPLCNIFMVGDEDQSIYGFRAAYPDALLNFESTYPGAIVLKMEKNYRCVPRIIEVADAFISKNTKRYAKHMEAVRVNDGTIREISSFDRYSQYKYLVSVARNCKAETAVLYRDNDSGIPIIDLLEREDIPYCSKQNDGLFFSCRVVRDISDYFRLALDPCDFDAFMRIYFKMGLFIKKETALAAVKLAREKGTGILYALTDLCTSNSRARFNLLSLEKLFDKLPKQSATKSVSVICSYKGYAEYLSEHTEDAGRINILKMLAKNEQDAKGLLKRLNELEKIIKSGKGERGNCPFILSTIHSSKGLEYDNVFLCDCVDGVLPSVNKPLYGAPEREVALYEEERRLFYVALTRAKNTLSVCTFKREDIYTSFSSEIFNKKLCVPETVEAPYSAGVVRQFTKKFSDAHFLYDENEIKAQIACYKVGTEVEHKKFGYGIIKNIKGDNLTIDFVGIGRKMLSLTVLLRLGLIEIKR